MPEKVILNPRWQLLGNTLRCWRKERRLTRNELAAKSGVSERHILNIESGKVEPKFDVLYKLIHALRISADVLFYPETPLEDKQAAMLMMHYHVCSKENQYIVYKTVECLLGLLGQNDCEGSDVKDGWKDTER